MNKNALVNYRTGEVIDLSKATPVEITEALSMLIIKRKELQAIEDKVKKHIKQSELYFNGDDEQLGWIELLVGTLVLITVILFCIYMTIAMTVFIS